MVFGRFHFSLIGLVVGIITDLTYVLIDPRIDFEARGDRAKHSRPPQAIAVPAEPTTLVKYATAAWFMWIFLVLFVIALFAEFIANDNRSLSATEESFDHPF